jgi:16S rRNA (uracil1498-N3)-methyltransferase
MRDIRIYVDQALSAGEETNLSDAAAHHLLRVLRLAPGSMIRVFNGNGNQFSAEIVEAHGRQHCRVRLGRAERPPVESKIDVTLAQAIGKGDRMDWCIQKSTELGVSRIRPLFTERTEVRLSGQRLQRRLAHWQGVATAAAEQSGRLKVPEIDPPMALNALALVDGLNVVLHPRGDLGPKDLTAPGTDRFMVIIGPEGGFSDAETGALTKLGCSLLSMGQRILRTETAGPAALAMLLSRFGDWA